MKYEHKFTPINKKKMERFQDSDRQSASPRFLQTEVLGETDEHAGINEFLSTPAGRYKARKHLTTMYPGLLARMYLHKSLSAVPVGSMDRMYSVRHKNETWMVGDSLLEIEENDDLLTNVVTYAGTRGLYEFLFMKEPKKELYNQDNLTVYKKILEATNAHRQN